MRRVYVPSFGGDVQLKEVFGKGGEAQVYRLPYNDRFVAKIYSDHEKARAAAPRVKRLAKISSQLRQNSEAFEKRILLPREVVLDPSTRVPLGFTMPRAIGPDLRTLYRWFHPTENPNPHAAMQIQRYARNVAALVHEVHRAGLRVADLNSTNFLATRTGAVFLIDTDSFAIPAPGADHARPPLNCPVGKAEFLPPELQGIPLVNAPRGEHQDCWSLAVLLFLLFARGTHPFDGIDERGILPTQQGARMKVRGAFPYGGSHKRLVPPPHGNEAWKALTPDVRSLMCRAFVDGHDDPPERPAALEWVAALDRLLRRGFYYCPNQHSFPTWTRELEGRCPKCGEKLGRWSTNPAERNVSPPIRTRASSTPWASVRRTSGRNAPYAERRSSRPPASARASASRHQPSRTSAPSGVVSIAPGPAGPRGAVRTSVGFTEGALSVLSQGMATMGVILLRVVSYLTGFAAGVVISLTVTAILLVLVILAIRIHLP